MALAMCVLGGVLGGVLGPLPAPAWAADAPAAGVTARQPPSEERGFFVHLGLGGVVLEEGATIYALDQKQIGADISIKSQLTFVAEVGYFLSPNLAVSLTGGLPPFAKIEAAGTMDGLGRIGGTTYGPATLTAHYHFREFGRLQPYVGMGPAFMYVFKEKDGLMSHLNIENTVGFALQAGADYMISDHWGIFFDVKKAILRTEGTGTLGGVPIKADIKLDPLVLHTGISYRF